MSDSAQVDEALGQCGWCEKPAVTQVVTRPGRKKRKTAPVCEAHAKDFERRGIDTVRVLLARKMEADRKRSTWARGGRPWR